MGFTKLFSDIVMSTIWREDDKTRIVWITMLATADAKGNVSASVPGLADAARVSVEDCRKALLNLSAPDPDSRTKDNEGRRIKEIDGGWNILNYLKYRSKNPSRADYFREYRLNHPTTVAQQKRNKPQQQITEAEAEAEAEGGKTKTPSNSFNLSEQIRKDRSFGKCCTFCGCSSKADSGRMVWRKNLPFCSTFCYDQWEDKDKKVISA